MARFHPFAFAVAVIAGLTAVAVYAVGCSRGASGALAEVNGQRVTRGAFERELLADYGALGLRTIADRVIAEQLAAKQGLKVDPSRVEALLNEEVARAGDHRHLEEKLKKQGQTVDDLRRELAARELVDQLVAREVRLTDADIEAYYQAHKGEFRHGAMVKACLILCSTRENAQAIRDVLDEPEADFAGLAKALSEDPGTKDSGGDMGWFERDDYAPEISDAAFKLAPGRLSDVIRCPDGFAILLVEAKKPAGHQSLDEVRASIESLLRRERETTRRATWPAEQRKRADITVYDPVLRTRFEAVRGS